MSKLYTADRFVTIGGTTAQYVTGTGSLATFPAIPSGADYIQNQNASAQSANMWISGSGTFNSSVTATNFLASNGGLFGWGNGSTFIDGDSSNQYIRAVVNNSERMRITSAGNVGIGTSAPSEKLQVAGNAVVTTTTFGLATNAVRLENATGDSRSLSQFLGDPSVYNAAGAYGTNTVNGSIAGIKFNWYSQNWMISATRSGSTDIYGLVISQNSTERLVIGNTGNVGIGTTSPNGKLNVESSTTYNESLVTGAASGIIINNAGQEIAIGGSGISPYPNYIQSRASGIGWALALNPLGGNVGIGTSSPGRPLTVASSNIGIRMDNSSNSNAGLEYYVSTGTFHNWLLGAQYNVANTFEITPSTTVGGTTYSTPAFVVNANGNVGIGTTTPDSAISGTERVLKISNSNLASIYLETNGGSIANYLNASRNLVWYDFSAASERMRLSSSGNLGIGTSSPSAKLYVVQSGNGAFTSIVTEDNARKIKIGRDQISAYDLSDAPNTLYINSDANIYMNSSAGNTFFGGNVGIGTTSPIGPLTVSALGNANTVFLLGRSADNATRIDFYNNAATTRLYTIASGNSAIEHYADANIPMVFSTNATERMRITAAGNVGIGTSSPISSLQVSKDQAADTAITVTNAGTVGSTTTMSFVLQEAGTPLGWFRRYRDGSGLNEIGFNTDLSFSGNVASTKAERMRITNAGNVGIGTSSPGAKLNIAGPLGSTVGGGGSSIKMTNTDTGNFASISAGIVGVANGGIEFSVDGLRVIDVTTTGDVGIGTPFPSQKLHVVGSARITGALIDSSNSAGTSGQVLSSTGTGTAWVTGGAGSSGTSGTSGASPTVPGSNNEVLTSDGSGGINAETNCIFDASIKTFIAGASIDPSAGTYLINSGVTSVLSELDDWGYSSNYNATGEIMYKQTSDDTITKGDAIYLKANNKWAFAKGSNGPSSSSMLGIALNDTTGADEFVAVLLKGFVSTVRVFDDTADAGAPMYLSTNAAQITDVAPTGTNSTVRIVGYTYINTNDQAYGLYILRFDPDSTWIDN